MQDGYKSGIVLPEWVYPVSIDEARNQTMAVIEHPITFVEAVRQQDTLLTAFNLMERRRRDHLPVVDFREKLVGVITREQISKRLLSASALGHIPSSRAVAAPAGGPAA
jgi:CBS domain-containing protein